MFDRFDMNFLNISVMCNSIHCAIFHSRLYIYFSLDRNDEQKTISYVYALSQISFFIILVLRSWIIPDRNEISFSARRKEINVSTHLPRRRPMYLTMLPVTKKQKNKKI